MDLSDPAAISALAVSTLTALKPYLSTLSDKALNTTAEKIGGGVPDAVAKLWKKLRGQASGKPAAEEAINDILEAPEDPDTEASLRLQLKKLLQQDSEFAKELNPLVEAAVQISVTGSGAAAQQGSAAAGERGVALKDSTARDIIIADNVVQVREEESTDATARREAYLSHVLDSTNQLSLTGIDPKAASEAETSVSLSAVYTALLTRTPEEHEKGVQQDQPGRDTRLLSALEELNQKPRLVLLGDPGSGKSTFVDFVAFCLAGEALGRDDANLDLLTAPLPDDNDEDRDQRQPWDHGEMLPVRIVLRDFAARGLPPSGRRATAEHLWRFICGELKNAALGDYAPELKTELLEKGGLLLLDGLDEVPEAEQRREQLKQAGEDFVGTFGRCRVLVTSRTYAYQKQAWQLKGFSESILAPFSEGQIRRFVDRWYAHIASLRGMNHEDAQGRAEQLKRAILGGSRLEALAERPLLLTLIASLHAWRGGSLPERREQLYADTMDLLLDWWESPKTARDEQGQVLVFQPGLAEWLKVDRDRVRLLLNELAYQAHSSQPDLVGTGDIAEANLVSGLMGISENPDVKPARLVEYLSQRAGLLLPRGVGVYTFPHRTFQEYLAACYLTDYDYPDRLAELARSDANRWREVVLLAGAKAARGSASTIWTLAEALCYRDPEDSEYELADSWGVHLAGLALGETADLTRVTERHKTKISQIRRGLLDILNKGQLPAVERAQAGNSLAQLGDPRFRSDAWYLPDEPLLGFVEVPAGTFSMGSDPEQVKEAHETPQHEVDLPGYYIGRYPVTVAQFRAFVEETGQQPGDKDNLKGVDNHPVVLVTWKEALAYCKWIEARLRNSEKTPEQLAGLLQEKGWVITLPSEAEWEKAARGSDGRIYPWGDEADPDWANVEETGIGTTSPIGCFPAGSSPYGVLDLSGNVWEWTRSLWGGSWKGPKFRYPYIIGDGREVLDASDQVYRIVRGRAFYSESIGARCAFRDWSDPFSLGNFIGFRVVLSPLSSDL